MTTKPPTHMTGAELQTLREACNLSREEFGELAGVAPRTVKHWENGRAGVPADVADMVQRLDYRINQAAKQASDTARRAIIEHERGEQAAELVLMRYRTAEDLARYRTDMDGLPASAHGAIIGRICSDWRSLGDALHVKIRIVWMNPEAYDAWRTACKLPDSETTRATWAAQQVEQQAIPHRGDQPPQA